MFSTILSPAPYSRSIFNTDVTTVSIQRPAADLPGSRAGIAWASVVKNLSASESARVLERDVQRSVHLISDEWESFMALGYNFVAHDRVQHSKQEYVCGDIHANLAKGFNSRVRRTFASRARPYTMSSRPLVRELPDCPLGLQPLYRSWPASP